MALYRLKKKKLVKTLIILFIFVVIFLFLGFKKSDSIKYTYKENNSVDYKVFLKENSYFDVPYLEKNKTYITSLIDYIDSTFNYNIVFNNQVSGNINYRLVAKIEANKANNETGNYWTKEYELTSLKTDNIQSKKDYSIQVKSNIDYNQYNDLLNSFINEYGLQTESILKVYLEVTGNVTVDNTNDKFDVNSEVSLTVPLSKLAVEGKIETSNINIEKEVKKEENETIRTIFRILSVVVILVFCYYLYQYIRTERNRDKHLTYRNKIRKINNDYDGVITKVKKANITNLNIIDVEAFDDLLNVYTSIREPINFQYGNEKSIYFIINNNSCYIYTINKEDFENYGKDNP